VTARPAPDLAYGRGVIIVRANGRPVELSDGSTLAGLLDALGLTGAVAAVEHNGEPVPRSGYATWELADGDRVELVRAVAGG
jgi:sulfur carrier protein